MRHLQIRLEDEEYTAFAGKAEQVGLSQQSAGKAAVLRWTTPQEGTSLLQDVSEPEAATLSWILEFLRDDSIPDPWGMRRVLLAKGKEWTSKRK